MTMTALEAMEKIETVVESWQKGDIESQEALDDITDITQEDIE